MTVLVADTSYQEQWNRFVAEHEDSSPYHQWSWLDAIEQAYGFTVFPLISLDDNGQVNGLFPIAVVKTPFSKGKMSSLPYCDIGGALAANSGVEQALLQHALSMCQQYGIASLESRTNELESQDINEFAKVRMILPLPDSSEQLMAGFKSKLRSQIKKASKNGLTATVGNDSQHLAGFYQVYSRNMRDLGSPAHSFQWFKSIVEGYGSNAIIANVYKEDTVVGAGIVLTSGNKCSIPWASTNADYNRLAPNMLLYWTLLSHASDNGYISFDFGRSTPGEGTYKFKAQWGAQPRGLLWQTFQQGQLQEIPPVTQTSSTSSIRKLVETVWQKLPVSIATTLGSAVRKYITL